jgi:hypothetical protein
MPKAEVAGGAHAPERQLARPEAGHSPSQLAAAHSFARAALGTEPGTIDFLARAGDRRRAEYVYALQRTTGNLGVARAIQSRLARARVDPGAPAHVASVRLLSRTAGTVSDPTAPNYDSFCDSEGHMATSEHVHSALAAIQNPDVLDKIYAHAAAGNVRASTFVAELEEVFGAVGVEAAEKQARLACTVPVVREFLRGCILNWSAIDYLAADSVGGQRLRQVVGDAYQGRAKQLSIRNDLILSSLNALGALGSVAKVIRSPRSKAGTGPESVESPRSPGPAETSKPTEAPVTAVPQAGSAKAPKPSDPSVASTRKQRARPKRQERKRYSSDKVPYAITAVKKAFGALKGRVSVYVLKAADGTVLYVGEGQALDRLRRHIGDPTKSQWFAEIDHVEIRAMDLTKKEALALEEDLIDELKPLHNQELRPFEQAFPGQLRGNDLPKAQPTIRIKVDIGDTE